MSSLRPKKHTLSSKYVTVANSKDVPTTYNTSNTSKDAPTNANAPMIYGASKSAGASNTSATHNTPTSIDTATGFAAPADLSSERVKEIFSSIAKKYERFNAISSFGAYKHWLHTMMKSASISHDAKVLDVAGGTGDVTFTVARVKHPAHILCTDLVPEMLDVARSHYANGAAAGVPIDFRTVDAQDMPFDDNTFDAVTMAYGIRNMPKREQALREIYRVLRPGGQLICLEFSTPPNRAWRTLYHFYLRHMIPFWGGLITGERKGFVYLSKSIKAFPDQAGLATLMKDVGLTNISWKNCTGGIAAVHSAYKPE